MLPRWILPLLRRLGVLFLLALSFWPFQTQAQSTEVRYFSQTGHSVSGPFRLFWEMNGGVELFGYPITEQFESANQKRVVQYFERARFELKEGANQAPTVELGLLGLETTADRIFPRVQPFPNSADRLYFPQTQHSLQYGFKQIWETRGAERIFGYPISEEIDEKLGDGEWHTVQYFERARFEFWPKYNPGRRVVFGALGQKLAPPELLAPVTAPPPPQPTAVLPTPTAVPAPVHPPTSQPNLPTALPNLPTALPNLPTALPNLPTALPSVPTIIPALPTTQPNLDPDMPGNINGSVDPRIGPPGTTFRFEAFGFNPGEAVGVWVTAPDQSTFDSGFQATADNIGSIAHENIKIKTKANFRPGVWAFNAQGVNSRKLAQAFFYVTPKGKDPVKSSPGDPSKLALLIHDQLPTQGNAFVVPLAAPAGIPFVLLASGYTQNETVKSWITKPDGKSQALAASAVSFNSEGVVQVQVASAGLAEGLYIVAAKGVSSGLTSSATFKVTSDYVAGPGTARPQNSNGQVTPVEGRKGTVFQIRGQGLQQNEQLEFWITEPNGSYTLVPQNALADREGRVGYEPPLDLVSTGQFQPGVYGIHFRGKSSGQRVDIYFSYLDEKTTGSSLSLLPDQHKRPFFGLFAP